MTTHTVGEYTKASSTMEFAHFTHPNNINETIISFKNKALILNREFWDLLSLNAPIERIEPISNIRKMYA